MAEARRTPRGRRSTIIPGTRMPRGLSTSSRSFPVRPCSSNCGGAAATRASNGGRPSTRIRAFAIAPSKAASARVACRPEPRRVRDWRCGRAVRPFMNRWPTATWRSRIWPSAGAVRLMSKISRASPAEFLDLRLAHPEELEVVARRGQLLRGQGQRLGGRRWTSASTVRRIPARRHRPAAAPRCLCCRRPPAPRRASPGFRFDPRTRAAPSRRRRPKPDRSGLRPAPRGPRCAPCGPRAPPAPSRSADEPPAPDPASGGRCRGSSPQTARARRRRTPARDPSHNPAPFRAASER